MYRGNYTECSQVEPYGFISRHSCGCYSRCKKSKPHNADHNGDIQKEEDEEVVSANWLLSQDGRA